MELQEKSFLLLQIFAQNTWKNSNYLSLCPKIFEAMSSERVCGDSLLKCTSKILSFNLNRVSVLFFILHAPNVRQLATWQVASKNNFTYNKIKTKYMYWCICTYIELCNLLQKLTMFVARNSFNFMRIKCFSKGLLLASASAYMQKVKQNK